MRMIPNVKPVDMTITAPVRKLCPFRDEVDEGTAVLTFAATTETPELHDLAADLALLADRRMSHEEFTHLIAAELGCQVVTTWETAGLTVSVKALR